MISRRKILSQSRDDLRVDVGYQHLDDEEDVWYQKEKCFNDHIKEVLEKWGQIDDEIWSKIIVLERNRRVAKAYARTPVLTVNGSDDGFDGFRIGLNGFENPMRDLTTEELKKHIGQGVKIKMDDAGNILVKRVSKCNVYVKATSVEENAIGNDILKLPNHALELDKPLKLFDMKKFQSNVNKEMKKVYPDRKRLEYQSLSVIAFVKSEIEMLQCPIWVLIINIVAIDMLKSKLFPVGRPMDIKNRPKIPIPDEDPYTVAGNGIVLNLPGNNNFQKRADKPPKLPPRENSSNQILHKPEYDDLEDNYGFKKNQITARTIRSETLKSKDKKHDDPYYCGLRARVPNFVKMIKIKEGTTKKNQNSPEQQQQQHPENHYQQQQQQQQQQHYHHHQPMFNKFRNDSIQHVALHHSKSYDQNLELIDKSFNPVYDRLLGSTKTYLQTQYQKKQMFIGEWD